MELSNDQVDGIHWLKEAVWFEAYPHQTKVYHQPMPWLACEVTQLCPVNDEGLILKEKLFNGSDTNKELTLVQLLRTDIRPVWKSEDLGIEIGEDKVEHIDGSVHIFDSMQPYHILCGSNISENIKPSFETSEGFLGRDQTPGRGKSVLTSMELTVSAQSSMVVEFFVSGSVDGFDQAKDHYDKLSKGFDYFRDEAPWAGEWLKEYKERMKSLPEDEPFPVGIFYNWAITSIADHDTEWTIVCR